MYKLVKNGITGELDCVYKEENGWFFSIPINPDNTDYQQYLKWVEEGNTPRPTDEELA